MVGEASSVPGMKLTIIGVACIGASLAVWGATGCGKKDASCDKVFEHTMELAPKEMRDLMLSGKDGAMAKCEKLTVEQRECIMDADNLLDLAACKHK